MLRVYIDSGEERTQVKSSDTGDGGHESEM